MLLSIIIPTYNRVEMIARAIDSVYSQELFSQGCEFEIIIVDDGSQDGTRELVRGSYPEVVYHYQDNRGVSAARNTGIERAKGKWIALLDSDDEWLPHKIGAQFDLLTRTQLKVCHTEEVWIRNGVRVNQMNKHKKEGGWIFERCLPLCAMSPSSILLDRCVFESVGVFDENLPACEDYDLWLRITSQYQVAYVQEPCIKKYGGHEDQLSRQFWGMDRFRVVALQKILEHKPPIEAAFANAAKEMLIKKLTILKNGAAKRGNSSLEQECQQSLAKALSI